MTAIGGNGTIAADLAAIMAESKAIGKDSRNQQQGFNFRGIDAVMNHLHPVFAKHGVTVQPEVLTERTEERQTKSGGTLLYRVLTVRFHFTAADGSRLSCVMLGEGMDSGDKAGNKAMAVALKYALTQMLLLPYDEVDPDADTPPPSTGKPTAPPAKKEQTAGRQPDKPPAVPQPPSATQPVPPASGYQQKKGCISEKQAKRLWAISKHANVAEADLREHLKAGYGVEHFNEIRWQDYEEICKWAESGGQDLPDDDRAGDATDQPADQPAKPTPEDIGDRMRKERGLPF